jgi:hypothetical protein
MVESEIGRPEGDEYTPFYAAYIARVSERDILGVLARQSEETRAALGSVPDGRAGWRYAPGKWTIREIVGHLADVERIFAYRALRIARGDRTPLAGFDENAYVPASGADARPLAELVEELAAVRQATLTLFRGLTPPAWQRRGTANGAPISVRALAYIIPGHERHHLEVLRTRYGVTGGETTRR